MAVIIGWKRGIRVWNIMEAKDLVFTKIKFLESTGDLPRSITRNEDSSIEEQLQGRGLEL